MLISEWSSDVCSSDLTVLLDQFLRIAIQLVGDFLLDVDVEVDLDRLVGRVDLHTGGKARRGTEDRQMSATAGQPPFVLVRSSHGTCSTSGGCTGSSIGAWAPPLGASAFTFTT